jgi:DNA-binding PucR family transcriptional regulator
VRGRRAVLLMPTGDYPALDDALHVRGWRGCTLSSPTLANLASSNRLAADALDTAPENAFHGRALLDEGDAQLLALLTAKAAANPGAVVRTILGPLAETSNAHLLEGLSAFLSTGSATAAAAHLHLHPQTLRYRLRRAHQLTGRDPGLPWQRLALDIARQLHQIQRRA